MPVLKGLGHEMNWNLVKGRGRFLNFSDAPENNMF
jgi:hypothetical protein